MPSGTGQSTLLSSVGNDVNKAHQEFKGQKTVYDTGGSLPAGIENGIAKLVDMKIDRYKSGNLKGKAYFYAAGIVVSPKEHEGAPVEGLRTQIMEPICDTPNAKGKRKTLQDHYGWVRNEISKFLDEGEIDNLKNPSVEIEKVLIPALLKAKPHFRFRTWKGSPTDDFPNPRTQEVWNGRVDYDPEAGDAQQEAVVDHEGESDEEEPDDTESEEMSLGERAQAEEEGGEDTGARAELSKAAKAADIDPEDYDTWQEVEAAIEEAGGEEDESESSEEGEGDEEGDKDPEKGETYLYNRAADIAEQEDVEESYEDELTEIAGEFDEDPDEYELWKELAEALAKKKGAKAEYEVTLVSASKRTVNLKPADGGEVVKGVSWEKLEPAE